MDKDIEKYLHFRIDATCSTSDGYYNWSSNDGILDAPEFITGNYFDLSKELKEEFLRFFIKEDYYALTRNNWYRIAKCHESIQEAFIAWRNRKNSDIIHHYI